jgi:hypothetical protein
MYNARPAQSSQTASSVTDPDPINAAIIQICKTAAENFQHSQDVKVIDDAIKEIGSRFPKTSTRMAQHELRPLALWQASVQFGIGN